MERRRRQKWHPMVRIHQYPHWRTKVITHIQANSEQQEKIYEKYLSKPKKKWYQRKARDHIYGLRYSWDNEDKVGFVSFRSYGRLLQMQMRSNVPCFFELQTDNVQYKISDPRGKILKRLTEIGLRAQKEFWNGNQI